MLQLQWIKSKASNWLSLESCDLSDVSTAGVYIIWHGGNPARVVKVGSGDIAARLSAHRNDKAILTYRSFGTLYVTWAAVQEPLRGGVERYLGEHWKPLVGDRFPDLVPVH